MDDPTVIAVAEMIDRLTAAGAERETFRLAIAGVIERWTPTPCARCGTNGGLIRRGEHRPKRISGATFGVDGTVCHACYVNLEMAAVRKAARLAKQAAAALTATSGAAMEA